MSKVNESSQQSKDTKRKAKTTKKGAKRGRPSNLDKLDLMVRGLKHENQYLLDLCDRMHQACENATKSYQKEAADWKSMANDWQGLYYTLKDFLYEDGPTPQDYTSRSQLAIRFMSKYRMN
jgi:hypothetical protein